MSYENKKMKTYRIRPNILEKVEEIKKHHNSKNFYSKVSDADIIEKAIIQYYFSSDWKL